MTGKPKSEGIAPDPQNQSNALRDDSNPWQYGAANPWEYEAIDATPVSEPSVIVQPIAPSQNQSSFYYNSAYQSGQDALPSASAQNQSPIIPQRSQAPPA